MAASSAPAAMRPLKLCTFLALTELLAAERPNSSRSPHGPDRPLPRQDGCRAVEQRCVCECPTVQCSAPREAGPDLLGMAVNVLLSVLVQTILTGLHRCFRRRRTIART
eukprot:7199320-Lingulodinium_polyedra.AAC.1